MFQENYQIAMAMTFWLANGSEFHHFLQKDLDMCVISQDAQDILFQSAQDAFRYSESPSVIEICQSGSPKITFFPSILFNFLILSIFQLPN